MSRRITKKTASPETIDVDTFKAWLQGVEDMQGADWHPNLEQWKKIRQKIEQLEASVEEVASPYVAPPTFIPRGLPPQPFTGGSVQGGPPQVMFNPAPPPSSLDTKPSDANIAVDGTFQSSFA